MWLSNAEYSSINSPILGNSTQYVKLSETELYVRIAIQKEDGTPYKVLDEHDQLLPLNKKKLGHLLISFYIVCGLELM